MYGHIMDDEGSSPLARGLHLSSPFFFCPSRIIPACAGFTTYGCRAQSKLQGSSPLARGLPDRARVHGDDLGIIPACAGFTRWGRGRGRRRRDHPRLRGVYCRPWRRAVSRRDHPRLRGVYFVVTDAEGGREGSSPLARGLHSVGDGRDRDARIIPACAGFTRSTVSGRIGIRDHPRLRGVYCRPWRRAVSRRDHPRLRGVYQIPGMNINCLVGSSPLARGLLAARLRSVRRSGIIPACAGFTPIRISAGTCPKDHPRLRGVYLRNVGVDEFLQGSSPLARGLRPGSRSPRPCPRDHPRLRGVYPLPKWYQSEPSGSSPLARGLLDRFDRPVDPPGIIPACAGFTVGTSSTTPSSGDHPRLRGVYADSGRKSLLPPGSSPLARGLPQQDFTERNGRGIIPACAGFTSASSCPRRSSPDHPRLRGVYRLPESHSSSSSGSSPLARGLRRAALLVLDGRGIIPACAGFTHRSAGAGSGPGDHPRLRGVYAIGLGLRGVLLGSSPLARGLHPGEPLHRAAHRIIPACAGFTWWWRARPRYRPDHPRLRGVYVGPWDDLLGDGGSSPLARGLPTTPTDPARRTRIIPACAGFTRPGVPAHFLDGFRIIPACAGFTAAS